MLRGLTSRFCEETSFAQSSSNSVKNSFGFRSTQPGLAINRRRKTPPTTSSPATSLYTTVNSSGRFHLRSGLSRWDL